MTVTTTDRSTRVLVVDDEENIVPVSSSGYRCSLTPSG
jgi:hypothetical protein